MAHLPQAVQNRIIVLLLAAAVDLLLGDPQGLWHPVQGIGTLICHLEKGLRKVFAVPPPGERVDPAQLPKESAGDSAGGIPSQEEKRKENGRDIRREKRKSGDNSAYSFFLRERIAGCLMVLGVLIVTTGLTVCLLQLCGRIHTAFRIAFEGILCGRLLALRSLAEAGFSVRDPLLLGDIAEARKAVSMIVGRDTQRLDAEGIAKAAVETVAENTSDGVTAPLFFMFLFGGVGGIFYKAVNTMDSMTGYKNDRYRYFGTAAARLDDWVNYFPSRLTALLMILACFFPGKTGVPCRETPHPARISPGSQVEGCRPDLLPDPGQQDAQALCAASKIETGEVRIPDGTAAFRIWRRDRRKSPSPNSAQTESVCAGALHLCLLGDAWYFGELHHKAEIGDGGRNVEPADITRAVDLMVKTSILMFLTGMTGMLLAAALL